MIAGAAGLAALKLRADPDLSARRVWGGEMAFILLLGVAAATGLVLYAATGTAAVGALLAIHLATVMALFFTDAVLQDDPRLLPLHRLGC